MDPLFNEVVANELKTEVSKIVKNSNPMGSLNFLSFVRMKVDDHKIKSCQ
jgi:hypothetical protein